MVENIGNHKESETITIRKHQVNNKEPSPSPTGGAGGDEHTMRDHWKAKHTTTPTGGAGGRSG